MRNQGAGKASSRGQSALMCQMARMPRPGAQGRAGQRVIQGSALTEVQKTVLRQAREFLDQLDIPALAVRANRIFPPPGIHVADDQHLPGCEFFREIIQPGKDSVHCVHARPVPAALAIALVGVRPTVGAPPLGLQVIDRHQQ